MNAKSSSRSVHYCPGCGKKLGCEICEDEDFGDFIVSCLSSCRARFITEQGACLLAATAEDDEIKFSLCGKCSNMDNWYDTIATMEQSNPKIDHQIIQA